MSKPFQELEFKDNFMFSATMLDPENCRLVLEQILGFPIERVEVSMEKSIAFHLDYKYKGVRLDVYAKDAENTRYDVEMQIEVTEHLKRARYYHSSMDMNLIDTGSKYEELPKCFVIFICDHDPFGLKKYRYTRRCNFFEDSSYNYDDGTYTIFLSTQGENDDEVPKELVNFLKFVGTPDKAEEDFVVTRLKTSISRIKKDREMEGRYMLFEELQEKNYQLGFADGEAKGEARGEIIGKAEAILTVLSTKGNLPENVKELISGIINKDNADGLVMEAIKAESVSGFFELLSSK